MPSIFDSAAFNERLFFARSDRSPCPAGAVDRWISVDERATLHARVHRCPSPRGAVLLFHGNGEVVADYDAIAPRFLGQGLTVAVVDFRGYGQSTGTPTLRDAITDAPIVLRALREELSMAGAVPLVVFGRSLGGHCAIELAANEGALCDGLVLESAGSDLHALIARRGLRNDRRFTDEELRVFDPRTKLSRCTARAMVIHGAMDTLIAPREAEANFSAIASSDKRLLWIAGRGHNDLSLSHEYWNAIASLP